MPSKIDPDYLAQLVDLGQLDLQLSKADRRAFQATPEYKKIEPAYLKAHAAAKVKFDEARQFPMFDPRREKLDREGKKLLDPAISLYHRTEREAYANNLEYRELKDKLTQRHADVEKQIVSHHKKRKRPTLPNRPNYKKLTGPTSDPSAHAAPDVGTVSAAVDRAQRDTGTTEIGHYSDLKIGGIPADKLYLVRVQGGLDGVRPKADAVVLNRSGSKRAASMNTSHFTINAVVKNHTLGTQFDGSAVAIIAPFERAIVEGRNIPSGLSAGDTWFHADKNGDMRLPGAQIFVPDNMQVPPNLEKAVQRYPHGASPEETMQNRDRAIEGAFKKLGAPLHSLRGTEGTDSLYWNAADRKTQDSGFEALAKRMMPDREIAIGGLHMHSSDGEWSRGINVLNARIGEYAQGQRLHEKVGGVQIPQTDEIMRLYRDTTTEFGNRISNGAAPNAIAHYQRQLEAVQTRMERDVVPAARQDASDETRRWRAEEAKKFLSDYEKTKQEPPLPTEAHRHNYDVLPGVSSAVGHHAGNAAGVAGAAINLAQGHVGAAAADIATTPTAIKAATEGMSLLAEAKGALPVVEAVGKAGVAVGKRIPVIGAVVTGGVVLAEVGEDVAHAEYGKAGAATAAGGAEMLGNTVGFGVGDAAREAVRGGIVATAGQKYAPAKSGLRQLGEEAVGVAKARLRKGRSTANSAVRKGQPKI